MQYDDAGLIRIAPGRSEPGKNSNWTKASAPRRPNKAEAGDGS